MKGLSADCRHGPEQTVDRRLLGRIERQTRSRRGRVWASFGIEVASSLWNGFFITRKVATMTSICTGGFLAIALIGSGTAVQAQSQQASQRVQAEVSERTSPSLTADELAGPMVVRQANGLDGNEIVLAAGDSIGKIDEVVYSNIDGDFYGVIEVDGILDVGEVERRIVALADLEYDADEDRLYLSPSRKVEELAEFDAELYSEIDNETTVQIRSRTGSDNIIQDSDSNE
jgi:hypothetical protein